MSPCWHSGPRRIVSARSLAAVPSAQGQCLCMGSVGFTAEAGKIVSVGRMVGMEGREFRFVAADDKFEAPAMLKPYNVSPAKLVAVGKLPNFFGAIVTRVHPSPDCWPTSGISRLVAATRKRSA